MKLLRTTTKKILKEKFGINAQFKKVTSIKIEQVKKKNKLLHSFFLIFCTTKTNDKIKYFNSKKNKSKIITSNYNLITNKLDKETKTPKLITRI